MKVKKKAWYQKMRVITLSYSMWGNTVKKNTVNSIEGVGQHGEWHMRRKRALKGKWGDLNGWHSACFVFQQVKKKINGLPWLVMVNVHFSYLYLSLSPPVCFCPEEILKVTYTVLAPLSHTSVQAATKMHILHRLEMNK